MLSILPRRPRASAQSALARVGVFQFLPRDVLASLAALAEERTFRPGAKLVEQGSVSLSMYALVQGRVRVERSLADFPHPVILAELGAGGVVGEMGVLDGEPRSATVMAIEKTVALELSAATLAATVMRHPETTRELLRLLSRRLRSTDELAVQLVRGQLRREWVAS